MNQEITNITPDNSADPDTESYSPENKDEIDISTLKGQRELLNIIGFESKRIRQLFLEIRESGKKLDRNDQNKLARLGKYDSDCRVKVGLIQKTLARGKFKESNLLLQQLVSSYNTFLNYIDTLERIANKYKTNEENDRLSTEKEVGANTGATTIFNETDEQAEIEASVAIDNQEGIIEVSVKEQKKENAEKNEGTQKSTGNNIFKELYNGADSLNPKSEHTEPAENGVIFHSEQSYKNDRIEPPMEKIPKPKFKKNTYGPKDAQAERDLYAKIDAADREKGKEDTSIITTPAQQEIEEAHSVVTKGGIRIGDHFSGIIGSIGHDNKVEGDIGINSNSPERVIPQNKTEDPNDQPVDKNPDDRKVIQTPTSLKTKRQAEPIVSDDGITYTDPSKAVNQEMSSKDKKEIPLFTQKLILKEEGEFKNLDTIKQSIVDILIKAKYSDTQIEWLLEKSFNKISNEINELLVKQNENPSNKDNGDIDNKISKLYQEILTATNNFIEQNKPKTESKTTLDKENKTPVDENDAEIPPGKDEPKKTGWWDKKFQATQVANSENTKERETKQEDPPDQTDKDIKTEITEESVERLLKQLDLLVHTTKKRREQLGVSHKQMNEESESYKTARSNIRKLRNLLNKKKKGEVVTGEQISELRQQILENMATYRKEVREAQPVPTRDESKSKSFILNEGGGYKKLDEMLADIRKTLKTEGFDKTVIDKFFADFIKPKTEKISLLVSSLKQYGNILSDHEKKQANDQIKQLHQAIETVTNNFIEQDNIRESKQEIVNDAVKLFGMKLPIVGTGIKMKVANGKDEEAEVLDPTAKISAVSFREGLKLATKHASSSLTKEQQENINKMFKILGYVPDNGLTESEVDELTQLTQKISIPNSPFNFSNKQPDETNDEENHTNDETTQTTQTQSEESSNENDPTKLSQSQYEQQSEQETTNPNDIGHDSNTDDMSDNYKTSENPDREEVKQEIKEIVSRQIQQKLSEIFSGETNLENRTGAFFTEKKSRGWFRKKLPIAEMKVEEYIKNSDSNDPLVLWLTELKETGFSFKEDEKDQTVYRFILNALVQSALTKRFGSQASNKDTQWSKIFDEMKRGWSPSEGF